MKQLIYGASIRGNGHYVSGAPCQDKNSFVEEDFGESDVKVIALADGHGGALYFRSDVGAEFAVKIAKDALTAFIQEYKDILDGIDNAKGANSVELINSLKDDLAKVKETIVEKWRSAVDGHLAEHPVAVANAELVEVNSFVNQPTSQTFTGYVSQHGGGISFINTNLDEKMLQGVVKNPRQIYGATLLCVGVYKTHNFIIQIGDGDVVVVNDKDEVSMPGVKWEEQVGNATNSLCQVNALSKFSELYFNEPVKLIMISTDGIVNGLEHEEELGNLARGIYASIEEEPKEFRSNLKPLLRSFSEASFDDCTICFVANGISDDAYSAMKSSVEQEEDNDLERLLQPKFKPYAINSETYVLDETADKPIDVLAVTNLPTLAQKILIECCKQFRKQVIYCTFIRKRLDEITPPPELEPLETALFNEVCDKTESDVTARLCETYQQRLEEFAKDNPLCLLKVTVRQLDKTDDGFELQSESPRYGLVTNVDNGTFAFVDCTEDSYQKIASNTLSEHLFVGKMQYDEQHFVQADKLKIFIHKEK